MSNNNLGNHVNGTQNQIEIERLSLIHLEDRRERKRVERRKQTQEYKRRFLLKIERQRRENKSNPVQFVSPTGLNAMGARWLYQSIGSMAKRLGEPSNTSQIWEVTVDKESVHFSIPLMVNSEELKLIRILDGEYQLPVPTTMYTKIRIHVATGHLEVRNLGLSPSISMIVAKKQTVEFVRRGLLDRKLTFTLCGKRALVFIERLRLPIDLAITSVGEKEQSINLATPLVKSSFARSMEQFKKRNQTAIIVNTQTHILRTEELDEVVEYQRAPVYSKVPVSYLRNKMTLGEIRQRILFLDCEFVMGFKELVGSRLKGTQLLASIGIMDYPGRTILDTRVTPAKKIRHYCEFITGFRPNDLKNQRKEKEIIAEVNQLVRGRILIGHDLTSDLAVLKISREDLAGIRDLSTAPVLRERIETENPRLSLKRVTEEILGRPLRSTIKVNGKEIVEPHSAMEDVKAIRDIYLKVESEWLDTNWQDCEWN